MNEVKYKVTPSVFNGRSIKPLDNSQLEYPIKQDLYHIVFKTGAEVILPANSYVFNMHDKDYSYLELLVKDVVVGDYIGLERLDIIREPAPVYLLGAPKSRKQYRGKRHIRSFLFHSTVISINVIKTDVPTFLTEKNVYLSTEFEHHKYGPVF